ncbi:hypothetical protein H4CHR_04432 [Variovorax sp. PBS-H4]|uniref:hypothetical protein n=1 Tax=Variovorax sp. PBS-H4 TaxID=434008 RepID=UPI0013193B58|nr:hypothetical protein [Variovorax sp. PBS-H4]VTU38464.1 hypothetical protein H4CHR_04432 [Variovorax sp. PBS-H4]
MARSSAEENRKPARRLALLRRRAEHLEQRIKADPSRPADHDKAEVAALRWAIADLEQKYQPKGLGA